MSSTASRPEGVTEADWARATARASTDRQRLARLVSAGIVMTPEQAARRMRRTRPARPTTVNLAIRPNKRNKKRK